MNFEPYLNDATPWATIDVAPVQTAAVDDHSRWIAQHRHASMTYMEKYADVRANPELLLPGARSMLIALFPYFTDEPLQLPVALYARGEDYHEVVRRRLSDVAKLLPGETRVCVDTAPLRERYWAARAGLGFIGRNNQLIAGELGSYFFIGTILCTAPLPREIHGITTPPSGNCENCRRCIDACPGKALSENGAVDARRCLSYLTIEHRGEFIDGTDLHGCLYGCDVCQRVCPHNANARPTPIPEFHPSPLLQGLTMQRLANFTPGDFAATFRHSAIRRTKLAGLLRNLAAITRH